MDIPLYFRSASKSSVVSSSSDSEDESEIDAQVLLLNHLPSQDLESGDTTKSGKKLFPWLEFDENLQGVFCKLFKKGGRSLQRTGGITKPFTNWKKATQKMKSHSKSEMHLLSCQLDVEAE